MTRHQAEEVLSALALEIQALLAAAPRTVLSSSPQVDIGRMPIPGPLFMGREGGLARLDAAWETPSTHALTFVAFGGVGKSALVGRWLDGMAASGWRGARRQGPGGDR